MPEPIRRVLAGHHVIETVSTNSLQTEYGPGFRRDDYPFNRSISAMAAAGARIFPSWMT